MTGFKNISCWFCSGNGVVQHSDKLDPCPFECKECDGSGMMFRYPSGVLAKWRGGPFIGKDSEHVSR